MDLSLAPTSQAPTQSVGTVRHASSETAQRQDFASIMLRNNTLSGSGLKQPKQPTPTELAQDAISITLVQPILAQLRATSQAWGPFAPSQAEKTFGQMADAITAKRIVRAANFPLVGSMAAAITRKAEQLGQHNPEKHR